MVWKPSIDNNESLLIDTFASGSFREICNGDNEQARQCLFDLKFKF